MVYLREAGYFGLCLTSILWSISSWRLIHHYCGCNCYSCYCCWNTNHTSQNIRGRGGGGGGNDEMPLAATGFSLKRLFHALLWCAMIVEGIAYIDLTNLIQLSQTPTYREKLGYTLLHLFGRATLEYITNCIPTILCFETLAKSTTAQFYYNHLTTTTTTRATTTAEEEEEAMRTSSMLLSSSSSRRRTTTTMSTLFSSKDWIRFIPKFILFIIAILLSISSLWNSIILLFGTSISSSSSSSIILPYYTSLSTFKHNCPTYPIQLLLESIAWFIHGALLGIGISIQYYQWSNLPTYHLLLHNVHRQSQSQQQQQPSSRRRRRQQRSSIMTVWCLLYDKFGPMISCMACYYIRATWLLIDYIWHIQQSHGTSHFESGIHWWILNLWLPTFVSSSVLLYAIRKRDRLQFMSVRRHRQQQQRQHTRDNNNNNNNGRRYENEDPEAEDRNEEEEEEEEDRSLASSDASSLLSSLSFMNNNGGAEYMIGTIEAAIQSFRQINNIIEQRDEVISMGGNSNINAGGGVNNHIRNWDYYIPLQEQEQEVQEQVESSSAVARLSSEEEESSSSSSLVVEDEGEERK